MKSKDISLNCVVCGKSLKPLDEGRFPPHQDMWDDAGVHLFVPGYGSRFDTTEFVIGLCDDCIDNKKQDGSLVEYQHEPTILEQIEERINRYKCQAGMATDPKIKEELRLKLEGLKEARGLL